MSLPAIDFAPDDKVLYLGIPDAVTIRTAAGRLSAGLLVAIDEGDQVRAARHEFRDITNVMFVPGTPDEIPWQDGFFTRVIDTRGGGWPNPQRVRAEVERVVARPV
jgi:hypothetical protein